MNVILFIMDISASLLFDPSGAPRSEHQELEAVEEVPFSASSQAHSDNLQAHHDHHGEIYSQKQQEDNSHPFSDGSLLVHLILGKSKSYKSSVWAVHLSFSVSSKPARNSPLFLLLARTEI